MSVSSSTRYEASDNESKANISELRLELQALQNTTASLKIYLQRVQTLKQELLHAVHNYSEMDKVNMEWLKELKEAGITREKYLA